MQKDLQQLWKILVVPKNDPLLATIELLKIEYNNKNQTTYFFLKIINILPIDWIKNIEEKLQKLQFRSKLFFTSVQEQYVYEDILTYWDYIKIHKAKQKDYINKNVTLKNLSLELNKLYINVTNESQLALIKMNLQYYQERLQKYGFTNLQLEIRLNLEDTDFILEKNIAIEKEAIRKFQEKEQQINKFGSKKAITTNSFNSKKRTSAVTMSLGDLEEAPGNVVVEGEIFRNECKLTKTKKWIYSLAITDYKHAITLKYFTKDDARINELDVLQTKDWIRVQGQVRFDNFSRELVLWINKFEKIANPHLRFDTSVDKRIEFHLHTKMSVMDGVTSIEDYVHQVSLWKHPAIAITDHLNVQSFPDAQKAQKKYPDVKIIYGTEMQMIDANTKVITNANDQLINCAKFVVFDIETTGLSSRYDEIIEFGAVVINEHGIIQSKHDFLIKPRQKISAFIENLTGITSQMVSNEPEITEVAPKLKAILEDAVLVAHNASFDIGFLQELWYRMGYGAIINPIIDTLQLSRLLKPQLRYHKLGTVAKNYNIVYNEAIAHRADYDAEVLGKVFVVMLNELKTNYQVNHFLDLANLDCTVIFNKLYGHHTMVLAKNQQGLQDLFKIVSLSHTKYYYSSPKILNTVLNEMRTNLLIGSGCSNGAVFEAALNKGQQDLEAAISFYDYIEVQPIAVYNHLLNETLSLARMQEVISNIIATAQKLKKMVIASSDAHYLNPQDQVFREVYINTKGLGGSRHPLYHKIKNQGGVNIPDQYLRTTNEMLAEFDFLQDKALIRELVIDNPKLLSAQIAALKPLKNALYTPTIDGVDDKLADLCYKNAKKCYGNLLPDIVAHRLKRELDAILKHRFGVIYWLAYLLVTKSLDDGYLVGSRGSVGSSLVATMMNITEVNPLPPHYICRNCQYSEFISDKNIRSGYDLASKNCPNCQNLLTGEGHDIPFETFLGFNGDKVPDIDLNFSGEYQLIAHNFIKEMFGDANVYRAGTISTVATKTAFGYAKGYLEEVKGITQINKAFLEWLALGCVGVKRTTGQHPGGIIIIPQQYVVDDFTPINFPADDNNSQWKTTHFDFHAIHDNLLKLDILGHVDPTALKMLHDLTGYDPKQISFNDPKVLSLFTTVTALDIDQNDINADIVGSIGLPEFGTQFVRKMLEVTKPASFADLVQISGLSHGTDVWLNNAQTMIKDLGLKLKDVIGCRDDIMTYLIQQKLPANLAFNIMENVRKGQGLTVEQERTMLEHQIPKWYIESCRKIKYMFPKAHATAYVLMAFRIAWYKINYPYEYYATYFSTRCDVFDIKTIVKGQNAVLLKLNDILARNNNNYGADKVSQKEKDLIPVLEVALEMYLRKIVFSNISIEHSQATTFIVKIIDGQKTIVPPLAALDGLGSAVATSIIEARDEASIISIEDLQKRTSITKTHLKEFEAMGVLNKLNRTDQLSINFFE